MATKDATIKFGLICSVCGSRNYVSTKNKMENKDKLTLNKFCNHCRKHTPHKEDDDLK